MHWLWSTPDATDIGSVLLLSKLHLPSHPLAGPIVTRAQIASHLLDIITFLSFFTQLFPGTAAAANFSVSSSECLADAAAAADSIAYILLIE